MMNKYQESLDDLWNGCPNPKEQVKSKEILQELVDKETPMKVIEKLDDVPVSYERFRKCPKCKDLVTRMYLYCPFCGQKLDWSDENA